MIARREHLAMTKKNYDIIYDESGKLLGDVFYEFAVQFNDEVDDPDCDLSWIVIPREPPADKIIGPAKDSWMYSELFSDRDGNYDFEKQCSLSQSHRTFCWLTSKEIEAEVRGGQRLSEFIPVGVCVLGGEVVVNEEFAQRLKKSGSTGLEFIPIEIVVNQTIGPDPKLFVLDFRGKTRERARKLVNVPNECPFCKLKPLICPECGEIEHPCSRCDQLTLVPAKYHEGAKDKRLIAAPVPKKGVIYSGKSWDGSDFCYPNIITKRALDWLLCVHAAPFYTRPARVLLDGMSKSQLEQLKKVQQPLTDN